MELMDILKNALDWFFSFKAFVMLPVLFLAIALIARMKLGQALMNALKIGAGFAGIFMIFDIFLGILKPAVAAMAVSRGFDFPVVDAGWPPLAAITWSSWIAPASIVLVIAANLLMVATKTTSVLYIDIWNYWHFALIGSLLLSVGAHPAVALGATVFAAVMVIKAAEWSGPYVEKETGITGVAVSPLTVAGFLPWAALADKTLGAIPMIRKLRWDPSRGKGWLSKIGDPMLIGFVLGLFFGILAGYGFRETAEMAVKIAAVMFILPRCGALIGEGTGAISSATQLRLAPLFGGRKLLIAMDTGFLLKNPSVMVSGLVLMPISLIVAFILPGNKVLPAGDLPNLMSVMSVITIVCGGNVLRSLIIALPIVVAFLYAATALAPLITELAVKAGALEGGAGLVSSFTDGGNPLRWWIFELFRLTPWALILCVPILALWYYASRQSAISARSLSGKAT